MIVPSEQLQKYLRWLRLYCVVSNQAPGAYLEIREHIMFIKDTLEARGA